MLWKKIPQNLSGSQFQRLTGVKKNTFEKMCFIIRTVKEQRRKHPKRGKQPTLGIEDQLLMMLMYHREYRTFLHIAMDYGISESQCHRIVTDLENILIQSNAFKLPGKKALTKSNVKWSVVVIDVGESPVERPKKKQRRYYSGKKKKHTHKTQLIVGKDGKIICVEIDKGRKHDFRVFKESGVHIHASTRIEADSGYQGIKKYHPNSTLPYKHSRKKPLTKQQKQHNHEVSSSRVQVEHIIRKLKVFKILGERYRNRRKRFGLRVNLIAGIYNYELYAFFN
ncbi:IS5 family transposase [Terrimonas sp.]|uniref:IS5 family transposase n=1 Tax=Terrimonas sp. TaxID=1914338 RepID=UPI000D5211FB|nr:IS5 family transposase [Terrimonas sp.]PVD49273.1 IS5 family transposase [Terrimonas sp.]